MKGDERMKKILFKNFPNTETPLNAQNLNQMQTNIENAINGGTALWTGAWFMNANQQAQLSENISDQNNGIVLIWSPYQNGQAQNWGFVHTFISKYQLQLGGSGVNCLLIHNDFTLIACKYVYINDNKIVGSNENEMIGTGSGITYKNNAYVLRAVIGV